MGVGVDEAAVAMHSVVGLFLLHLLLHHPLLLLRPLLLLFLLLLLLNLLNIIIIVYSNTVAIPFFYVSFYSFS